MSGQCPTSHGIIRGVTSISGRCVHEHTRALHAPTHERRITALDTFDLSTKRLRVATERWERPYLVKRARRKRHDPAE
jgi:hypothetical protein